MASLRPTAHDHGHSFPICAHFEFAEFGYYPLSADALERSRFLSAIAGWPGEVTDASMDDAIATYGVPYVAPEPGDPAPTLIVSLAAGKSATIAGGVVADAILLNLPVGSGTAVTFAGTSLAWDAGTRTLTGDLGGTDAIDVVVITDGTMTSATSTAVTFEAA